MVRAKAWVMKTRFSGAPKPSDFAVIEEDLPHPKEGEFLCQAEVWSVDPYNRAYAGQFPDGTPMIGFQIAKVLESKSSKFPVGARVVGHFGWRTHTIASEKESSQGPAPYLLPDMAPLPPSVAVGVLGMPGMTAYFGLLEVCKPKAGETVVVNAASGAVGSAVCQIAKIKGCRVLAYAGSDDKVAWLKELGVDHAFNYKTEDLDKTLSEKAPKGVDCFFDNVGGMFAVTVYKHLSHGARICQCGAISSYNLTESQKLPDFLGIFIGKEATLQGFHVSSRASKFPEGIHQMAQWMKEGKLKYREKVYEGFESMPQALIALLDGSHMGKVVIKA